ncbi:MAG: hypothetical protein ACRD2X_23355, partial [Vicinamibacteraceae bacterium]
MAMREANGSDQWRVDALESPESRAGTERPDTRPVAIPSPPGRPRVVIIGGGFGGLNAARALKRA